MIFSLAAHFAFISLLVFTQERPPANATEFLLEFEYSEIADNDANSNLRPSETQIQSVKQQRHSSDPSKFANRRLLRSRGTLDRPHQTPDQSELNEAFKTESGSDLPPRRLYLARLRNRIGTHQVYPRTSKMLREEGTVRISLLLKRSGQLEKLELLESSRFSRLDDAAIKAIAKAAPFDPFPSEVPFDSWEITVPVRFQLN